MERKTWTRQSYSKTNSFNFFNLTQIVSKQGSIYLTTTTFI